MDGDEVIVLKSRQGLVKLAFRTGAALVPCYLLGNTHLLSLWCGGDDGSFMRKNLQWLSRKLGNLNSSICLICKIITLLFLIDRCCFNTVLGSIFLTDSLSSTYCRHYG